MNLVFINCASTSCCRNQERFFAIVDGVAIPTARYSAPRNDLYNNRFRMRITKEITSILVRQSIIGEIDFRVKRGCASLCEPIR